MTLLLQPTNKKENHLVITKQLKFSDDIRCLSSSKAAADSMGRINRVQTINFEKRRQNIQSFLKLQPIKQENKPRAPNTLQKGITTYLSGTGASNASGT